MEVGERFTRNGKTYEVSEVWGNNYGFHEVEEEAPVEEVREELTFEEEVEKAIEAPKKRARRKKA